MLLRASTEEGRLSLLCGDQPRGLLGGWIPESSRSPGFVTLMIDQAEHSGSVDLVRELDESFPARFHLVVTAGSPLAWWAYSCQ